jgi:hypothetical protein
MPGGSAPTPTPTTPPPPQPTQPPVPTPTPTPQPKRWVTIGTYGGNGDGNTPTFTVTGSQWRIVWSCDPSSIPGGQYFLGALLTVPGQPYGDGVMDTTCQAGNTSGSTIQYTPGTYYLNVISQAAWTFQVQVYE